MLKREKARIISCDPDAEGADFEEIVSRVYGNEIRMMSRMSMHVFPILSEQIEDVIIIGSQTQGIVPDASSIRWDGMSASQVDSPQYYSPIKSIWIKDEIIYEKRDAEVSNSGQQ